MRIHLRYLIYLALVITLLAGCTRNRAEPEPTATDTPPAQPVQGNAGGEPKVEIQTPTPGQPAEQTETPTTEATATTSATGQRFQYTVQAGDTISSIAEKFETTVEMVKQLNFLIDEKIFVGQVLELPYKEGMTVEGAPTPTPAPFRYTVQKGDTLGDISAKFNVSTIAIIERNNLQNPNSLVVGQEIEIPGFQPPATGPAPTNQQDASTTSGNANSTANPDNATPANGVVHIVQPGEGLLSIAAEYGVEASAIAEANNITNPNQLRVGQKLTIPGVSKQEAEKRRGEVHVVQSGESLLSIATQYGVTVEEILALNNIQDPNAIYVGQELTIPAKP